MNILSDSKAWQIMYATNVFIVEISITEDI